VIDAAQFRQPDFPCTCKRNPQARAMTNPRLGDVLGISHIRRHYTIVKLPSQKARRVLALVHEVCVLVSLVEDAQHTHG
jgi:hypothetical protein